MPNDCELRTNRLELRRSGQIQTICPNLASPAYAKIGETSGCRQISVSAFRRKLMKLDLGPRSPILRNAAGLAASCRIEPVELLNMAICRAAGPKASRPDIEIIPFLTMLMRSIVSGIAKRRRLASEHGVTIPFDHVHEQVPSTGSIQDPVRTIERARDQMYFAGLLEELHDGDPLLSRLIDAIGKGYRGSRIQRELVVGVVELATLRRKLKRKATYIVLREGLIVGAEANHGSCPN